MLLSADLAINAPCKPEMAVERDNDDLYWDDVVSKMTPAMEPRAGILQDYNGNGPA